MTSGLEGFAQVPDELPEVRILRIAPGDVLVLRIDQMMTEADYHTLADRIKDRFPDNPCMLLDGGLTLDAVLRKGD